MAVNKETEGIWRWIVGIVLAISIISFSRGNILFIITFAISVIYFLFLLSKGGYDFLYKR